MLRHVLVLLFLAGLAAAAHPDLGGQVLLPALKEVGKALSEAEAGNRAALLQASPAPGRRRRRQRWCATPASLSARHRGLYQQTRPANAFEPLGMQAHDALWPALKVSLRPLLVAAEAPLAPAARRRLAAAAPLTLRNFNETLQLLGQYSAKMLQLQALDVEQTISNNLKV